MDRAAWVLPNGGGGPMIPGIENDPEALLRLANARMPFGRYKGELLLDVPPEYVFWFANQERVSVGTQLAAIYAIRFNGLEQILRVLVDGDGTDHGEPSSVTDGTDEMSVPDELDWIISMLESEQE